MNSKAIYVIHFNALGSGMAKYADYIRDCYCEYYDTVDIIPYPQKTSLFRTIIAEFLWYKKSIRAHLASFLNSYSESIIHITDTPIYVPIIIKYLIRINKKIIITIHDPVPHGETGLIKQLRTFILIGMNKYICLLSRQRPNIHIHLHSESQKEFCNTPNILVCPHPIGKEHVENSLKTRCEYDETLHIVYIGRIEYYKGVDIFYESARESLRDESKNVKFTIAGRGALPKMLMHDKICIINKYLSDVEFEEIINSAHVIVLPYRNATQSGVLNYAIALNKPVIVNNVGLMNEYVKNNETGYILESLNVQSLITLYEKILNNKGIVEKFSRAIIKYKYEFAPPKIGLVYWKYIQSKFL